MTFAMCWKCCNCLKSTETDHDGTIICYRMTGCKENKEIKSLEDAQIKCPLFKEDAR